MIKAEWTNKDSLDLQPTCNQLATTEGDLISRKEVLNMIIVAGECEPDLGYTHLHTVIESLPSAEPKTGKWMPCAKNGLILTELIREEDVAKWYGYKCSECNYIHKGNALIEYSYCPNCGADMRGKNDEKETEVL